MSDARLGQALQELPAGKLRLAYSAGMDSTVLLHSVAENLRRGGGLNRLTAHHLHHGLMSEATKWAAHCREVAHALGVDFACDRLDVPRRGNLEAAAREARYRLWEKVLDRDETLLLAHHADDQAETMLMRLMRGVPSELLAGMPRQRSLGRGRLLRPFLALPRSVLADYAKAHGLDWCEDPSNADITRDRNFIRHQVLPPLKARWPELVTAMATAGASLAREFELLDAELQAPLREVLGSGEGISIQALLARAPSLRLPLLRRALAVLGVHSLSEAHLSEILRQVQTPGDRMPTFALGKGVSLVRFAGTLKLRKEQLVERAARHNWVLDAPLRLAQGRLSAQPAASQKGLCLSSEHAELQVRFAVGGERLRVGGMTKKVSRLLQEARVAPWLREGWPLLYGDGILIGVAGIALDDRVASDHGWLIHWSPE